MGCELIRSRIMKAPQARHTMTHELPSQRLLLMTFTLGKYFWNFLRELYVEFNSYVRMSAPVQTSPFLDKFRIVIK